jgi:subtilase family serine protease
MIRRLFINIPIYAIIAIVLISQTIFARQLEWQWQNPLFQGNHLYALWASTNNQLIAGGALGTIITYDGNQWQEHHIETLQNIRSIWANDRCRLAVGDMGQAIQYIDNEWQISSISHHPLNALWAINQNNIYAFGDAGTIIHYSGRSWKSEQSPTASNLIDAIGFGEHIFVVGTAGTFLYFDTTGWHVITPPKLVDFKGIWGSDQHNLFVCGTYLDTNWHQKSCVYAFDGVNWQELGAFASKVVLTHIWGDQNDHIYVSDDKGRIFKLQDSQWKEIYKSAQGIYRIARMNEGFVAVGENGQFIRENNSIWYDDIDSPNHTINAIWGDSSHTFAVCQSGVILTMQNHSWHFHSQPITHDLKDISGDDNSIFVVGESGFIATYDGQVFTPIETPTNSDIFAISLKDNIAIAVGERGLIMHYENNIWELKESPTNQTLYDVWTDVGGAYAVGKNGTVIYFNGTSWQSLETPTTERLYTVWGTGPTQVFAAGKYGNMIQFDGHQWQLVDNFPTSNHIMSMWGQGDRLFATGDNGALCAYDGSDWQLLASPCASDIHTVWGRSDTDIFIGGANGIILHYPYQVKKTIDLIIASTIFENHGKLSGQLLVSPVSENDLVVELQSSSPNQLIVPQSVIVPSGYTMAQFEMTVVDNRTHDGQKYVNVEAKADNFSPSVVSITINDDESDRGIWVTEHFPQGKTAIPIDHVDIRFNRDIDIQSFDRDDIVITGPQGALALKDRFEWHQNTVSLFFDSTEITGNYTICVGPDISGNDDTGMDQDGDEQFFESHDDVYVGHFLLEDQTGPYVVARFPNERIKGPIPIIIIEFNEAIDAASISINDISMVEENGEQIVFDQMIRQNAKRFEIIPKIIITSGSYTFKIGPNILDLAGNLMNQDQPSGDHYECKFVIDQQGPRIFFHSLFGKQNKAISFFDLNFNEAILTRTFTLDTLSFAGSAGPLPIERIQQISVDVYRIFISPQYYDDIFEIVLQPTITDLAGNLLDQDNNGIGGEDSDRFELSFQQELPDLTVTQIEYAPEAQPGANIEINWVVQNNGLGATSGCWRDEIYLSDDPIQGNDTFVTAVDNQFILSHSEQYFRSISIPVPDKNETHHWVIIQTNPKSTPEEKSGKNNQTNNAKNIQDENNFENNQTISSYPFWNTQRAYPDLVVSNVYAPETIYVGESVRIAWQVVNQGNGPTSATVWMDRVVLSTDHILDDQDIEIACIRNPDFLASGEKYLKEHEIVLSPDLAEDTYYIFVHSDANDQVEEFDQESNNLISAPVPVSVQIPVPGELIVTSFLSPDQASPGDNIQLTWTVYNVGQATINAISHMILLSNNKQIDPENDAILFWTNENNYRPGQSYTLSHHVKMPSLIEMGTYYLIPATNQSMHMETPVAVPITMTSLVFPDLMVSNNMRFPAHIETDQLLTISWQVVNIGQGNTLVSNWLDYIYLSKDQMKSGNDIFLGSSRHEKILDATNGQVQITKTFIIPEHLNGHYFVGVHTDALQSINESNENNNISFSQPQIYIQHKQTDLTVVSANAPYSAITGQSASFQWSVKNIGIDPCIKHAWIDRVFLSSDKTLDENDMLLGEIDHTRILESEQSVAKSLTSSMPALLDGHYYAIIQVDAQDAIYEADAEQNNIFVIQAPIHVHQLFPDLRIGTINIVRSPAYANETTGISYTLINDGQTDTYGQWRDRFYLSQDSHLNTETDVLIGEIDHQAQISMGSRMCMQNDQLMIPAQISGMYTIFVQVDAMNQLYEYQGENNNQAAISIEIADSPADLKVINIQAPIKVDAGTAIHVSWDVMNMGRQDTQEAFWYDRIYLSRDNILSPAYDIELGNIIHKQPLKAGEKYTSAHYFVIQQDLGGTYNILVQTDAQNQVYENNHEDNNIMQAQTDILLVGVYVDLIASDLQFDQHPWAGQSIEVSWSVTNEGFDSTHVSSWEDIIYFSNDTTPDINDTVLGVYQHNGALASGETYHKSKTIQMPKDAYGTYYLIVKTDANVYNDVYENQAEENNYVFDEIVVDTAPSPNLRVTNLTIPAQVWSGQYLRIGWSVENNGEIAVQPETGFWYDSVYLSRDPFLDIVHDIPVGNVRFDGTLASHSNPYTQVLETMLPPGISGPYYVIVLADSSIPKHVYESNRTDNVFISNHPINIQLTPPSDLLVTHLTTPDTGLPGQILEWQFVVKNTGLRPAVGAWYDTLYLSSDDIWDIDDYRIARYYHDGDISTGNAYTAVVHAEVPTAISGKYHVIVRTDILNDIRETNEHNNLYLSSQIIQIENTILNKDVTIQDRISSGELRYYQINIPQDEDIEIVLNGPTASCYEMVLGNHYIPGRSHYDQRGVLMNDSLILNQSGLSQGIYYLTLYGLKCENPKSFELSLNYLVNLRIHDLSVSKASNIGMTTLQIEGAHFQPGINVRLTRDHTDLNRVQSVNVLNSGQIALTLDLNDLTEGTYQIVLQNPDNEIAKTAFEVVNEKRGELFARLLIPGYVTQNKIYQFTLEYGNVGHSDILAPLLVISAGEGGLLRKDNDDAFSVNPIQILGISDLYPVDVLPPNTFNTVKFEFMLISEAYVPFYIQIMDQPDEPIDWDSLHSRLKPEPIDDNIWEVLFGQFKSNMGKTWGDYVNRLRQNAVENAYYGNTTHDVQSLLPNLSAGRSDIKIQLPIPPGTRRTSGGSIAPDIADVHDKLTSIGTGTLHHILFDGTIEYTIRFENKSTANASAQFIQIDDLLHEQLDLDTFELKEIALGNNQLDIPPDHSYYQTRLDLRPTGQNIFVDIEAGIDYHTRMARWIFTAIDPKTGEQSEDPLNGFLPPNESDNKGEGLVRFQIKPRSGIESGTIINNMATIIFDRNEPVDTPIAYNTVDLSIPESKVKQDSPPHHLEISISWGGQDTRNGSGISTYDIYVSDNAQPYELWLSQTKATSGIYIGNPGHRYSFYSIATDKVGNVESVPAQPDVVITLDSNLPPDAPVLISPENHATPLLKTGAFSDSDRSSHMATRWQISKTNDFSMLVMDRKSQIFLTELPVPYGILSALEKYYWRACHIDSHSSVSDWSETDAFTTTDIMLPVITDSTIDLDQDGTSDISQTNMALIQIGTKYMSVKSQTNDVSIVTARSIENTFGDFPADMPYGLISFRATCPVGEEIDVEIHFSEEIPLNASWYKFDYNNGFIDYSAHTQKNLPGHTITVQLKDGGYGDADGVANGVVVDPGGIGIFDENDVMAAGDDSSNCFIGIIQF